MNKSLTQIFAPLLPFIILGIAIALFIGLFIMLSYVLVWGIVLGGIFWLVAMIKNYLFPSYPADKKDGRIIEHDNNDEN